MDSPLRIQGGLAQGLWENLEKQPLDPYAADRQADSQTNAQPTYVLINSLLDSFSHLHPIAFFRI